LDRQSSFLAHFKIDFSPSAQDHMGKCREPRAQPKLSLVEMWDFLWIRPQSAIRIFRPSFKNMSFVDH
jgi:hypothetical protein